MKRVIAALAATLLLSAPVFGEIALAPGSTATVRLSPQDSLTYAVEPPPPEAPANFGAVLSIEIGAPGVYHVALSAPGWVDIIRDGAALTPVGEPDSGDASDIAKIIDYDLAAGSYLLALSGMTAGTVRVTLSRDLP